MDYKIFLDKSEKELLDLIEEYKAKLFTLRFKNQTGNVEKTHHIRLIKKDIARALTALNALKKGEK